MCVHTWVSVHMCVRMDVCVHMDGGVCTCTGEGVYTHGCMCVCACTGGVCEYTDVCECACVCALGGVNTHGCVCRGPGMGHSSEQGVGLHEAFRHAAGALSSPGEASCADPPLGPLALTPWPLPVLGCR